MSDDRQSRRPEHPRSEPEIIPPERDQRRGKGPVWVSVDQFDGTHRVHVARPGVFTILAVLFLAGLILAAVVLLLAGLVLFWIPVAVLIVAALIFAGYVRHYWARLKLWAAQRLS